MYVASCKQRNKFQSPTKYSVLRTTSYYYCTRLNTPSQLLLHFFFQKEKAYGFTKESFSLREEEGKKKKKKRYVRRYIPLFHSPQRAICARVTCARLQWGVPASIPDCSFFPLPQVINLMDRKAQGHRVFVMERMSWGLGEPPFYMHILPVSIRVLNANGYSRPRVLHHITPYSGGWLV